MPDKTRENAEPLFAIVALDTPSTPIPGELYKTLAAISGATVDPRTTIANEEMLTFLVDGATVAMTLIPAPIAWSRLEGPCETAWWWPDAAAKLQGHTSHLLIGISSENPHDRLLLHTAVRPSGCR